jgi:hypothetical protein
MRELPDWQAVKEESLLMRVKMEIDYAITAVNNEDPTSVVPFVAHAIYNHAKFDSCKNRRPGFTVLDSLHDALIDITAGKRLSIVRSALVGISDRIQSELY